MHGMEIHQAPIFSRLNVFEDSVTDLSINIYATGNKKTHCQLHNFYTSLLYLYLISLKLCLFCCFVIVDVSPHLTLKTLAAMVLNGCDMIIIPYAMMRL